jgi:hypothetical protein
MRCTAALATLLTAAASAERTIINSAGAAQVPDDEAPSTLRDDLGCISSARHALLTAGESLDELLEDGEIRTSTNTALLRLEDSSSTSAYAPTWGVLWAQVACAALPDAWPIGQTEHEWACAGLVGLTETKCAIHGTVTWMLAAGAGEGQDHVELHVPPSQRAQWRPLGLVRSPVVELFMRDAGCSVQYVYKGTRHPTSAPRCKGDDFPADGSHRALLRPPLGGWYTPPDDDGTSFRSSAVVRWLVQFPFASRGAHGMLIASDAPRAWLGYGVGLDAPLSDSLRDDVSSDDALIDDGMVTTASECLHSRCAVPLTACYRAESCRDGWSEFSETQGGVPWNQTALDAAMRSVTSAPLRLLVECFSTRCTCQARDARPHAVRFTAEEGLDDDEIASILKLASEIGISTRRAFGVHEGGLSAPGGKRGPIEVALGHNVTFLHARFAAALPALHAKLLGCAHRAHEQAGWQVLQAERVHIRTIELLEYSGEADSLGWHVDEQSAVTILVLLSSPADFDGALLQHEVRGHGAAVTATMVRGDVTVYRSHQAHRVTPLTRGVRRALAMELWHHVELPPADGRAHRPYGQCPAQ